jgi:predicted AlkP superfamily pyrophosphatase or phosphodiesterase
MKYFVYHLLFTLIVVGSVGCTKQAAQNASKSPEKVLLISFDGFRYDYLKMVDTPHFDSLAAEGVQAESLIPVFPTKTFPNHYSIVTGLYPEHSGLVGNTMYDPVFDAWYRISDRAAVEDARWYGGEPIWNTLEKQGIRTGTMFWVGSEAPIQNIRPTFWKPFDGDMPFKARIDTVVKWLSYPEEKAVDFATLYFEHVDGAGHRHGLKSAELKEAIREADRLMGYLKMRLREAGLWEKTNIIVVSDHGMTELSADKTIVLDELIDLDDVERIVWDPVTLIQPKEGLEEKVLGALKSKEQHYRVYKKSELPNRYHFKNHRRVLDIILIADPGYTVLKKERVPDFIESLPGATHGYDNAAVEMRAFFLAAGPDFKEGKQVGAFQNVHLYELMNHLMGTRPAPNDGSLDSVKVLLK